MSYQIIKFRLGSHKLPIETGRWNRTPRNERICSTCGVLGDEPHYLHVCVLVKRDATLPQNIEQIWQHPSIFSIFSQMHDIELL